MLHGAGAALAASRSQELLRRASAALSGELLQNEGWAERSSCQLGARVRCAAGSCDSFSVWRLSPLAAATANASLSLLDFSTPFPYQAHILP